MSNINIDEYTVEKIKTNTFFNIPIYQRPYAWTAKEVEVLLIDFYNAFRKDKEREKNGEEKQGYYIGNIVTFPNSNKLDIVDGQQRFTTLFLIGEIVNWNTNINLDYEIRENDRDFLEKIQNNKFDDKEEYLGINNNLTENLKFIKTFFEKKSDEFKFWIKNNVKFVLTILSNDIDVNKYFEVMNDRGVQLEKHHILKANLLHNIKNVEEQQKYAKIWDYCSDMNVYLEEYILKDEDNDNKIIEVRKKLLKNPIEQFIGDKKEDEDLLSILTKDKETINKDATTATKKQLFKSIISFETFLLHIYKIETDNSIKINDSDLLKIIDINKVDAKEFIEAILKYRVLFDYFVFKRDKDQKSYLRTIDSDGVIKSDNSKLLMIELLFEITSSKFNPWLTDFLIYIEENKSLLDMVEKLDKKDREKALARKGTKSFEEILNQGVSTPHYWFYKLDYLLWKDFPLAKENTIKEYDIKNFRLKYLSSIEHINPQTPQLEDFKLEPKLLDTFGNLALISDHMNSSLSNNPFNEKREQLNLQIERNTIESLKMLLIYSNDLKKWDENNVENHQKIMLEILENDLK